MKKDDFVAAVQDAAGLPDRKEAERYSKAVLEALVSLLADSEVRRHFIAPLPGSLKTELRDEPPPFLPMDRDAFLQHVGAALGTRAPGAARAVGAVYGVLLKAIAPGGIARFEAQLPRDIAVFLQRAKQAP